MLLTEIETDLDIILRTLRLDFNKRTIVGEASVLFIIEQFGTIVCGIDRADYLLVSKAIERQFGSGWRVVYVTTQDSLLEKKEELIWELMRGGYMNYIRSKYPVSFKQLITMQGFDRKVIKERLKVWGNAPKYRFLIEENEAALREATTYILSVDPAFFDSMP